MAELTRYGFYIRPSDGSNQFHEAEDGSYCLYSAAMEEIERLRRNETAEATETCRTLDVATQEIHRLRAALVDIRDECIIQGMSPAFFAQKVLRGAVETAAVQSDAEIEAELAMDRRIFGTAYYRRVNGRKERIPPQELFICTEQRSNRMRVAGPEASGEATGPEGDDSNMGTAPTSGPEATSSQGNAVETSAFRCKANRTADPPQDCDWPHCGCDPKADKVLEALSEEGILDDAARYQWMRDHYLSFEFIGPHGPTRLTKDVDPDLDGWMDAYRFGKPYSPAEKATGEQT